MKYYDTLFKNANPDLFYDSQIINKSLTWRLTTGKNDEVVLAGILNDVDTGFSYQVGHDYSGEGNSGGFTSAVRKVQGVARAVHMGGKSLAQAIETQDYKGVLGEELGTKVESAISKAKSKLGQADEWADNADILGINVGNLMDGLRKSLYGSFVSAFDFIKVFQGSSIDINLPTLDVILFDLDGCSIYETVDALNDKFLSDFKKEAGGVDANFWGVQTAPNNYEPQFNVFSEEAFQGTFTLYLGDKYMITNLIPTGFNVNLSQFTRMGTNNPLFAEVTVQVGFASYITKEKLRTYLQPMRTNK